MVGGSSKESKGRKIYGKSKLRKPTRDTEIKGWSKDELKSTYHKKEKFAKSERIYNVHEMKWPIRTHQCDSATKAPFSWISWLSWLPTVVIPIDYGSDIHNKLNNHNK